MLRFHAQNKELHTKRDPDIVVMNSIILTTALGAEQNDGAAHQQ